MTLVSSVALTFVCVSSDEPLQLNKHLRVVSISQRRPAVTGAAYPGRQQCLEMSAPIRACGASGAARLNLG